MAIGIYLLILFYLIMGGVIAIVMPMEFNRDICEFGRLKISRYRKVCGFIYMTLVGPLWFLYLLFICAIAIFTYQEDTRACYYFTQPLRIICWWPTLMLFTGKYGYTYDVYAQMEF